MNIKVSSQYSSFHRFVKQGIYDSDWEMVRRFGLMKKIVGFLFTQPNLN